MPDQLTVGAVVANAARGAPERTAAVVGGRHHTFAELDRAGNAVAQQLVADGHRGGDTALVIAATSFELLAHYVGCARAGVIFAPANPALDGATLLAIATNIQASLLLTPSEHHEVAARLDLPTRWFTTGSPDSTPRDSTATVALPKVGGAHPHIAFFTSGSTGVPKAALLSHQTSVLRSHPGSQLEPRGAALCPYPLFHMAGWTIALQQWHARASVVFVEGTDARVLIDALQQHRIERFNAIPALWMRVADQLAAEGSSPAGALPDLRFADTGTSPTSAELLSTIAEIAPNAHVRVFYGSSEAGNVASLHHDELLNKPNSCGRPNALTDVALADDGELLVQSPLLFDRYLGNDEATASAFADGWYRTGDRATIDSDGDLSITGRTGIVIRSGGESITPSTVEAALLAHPAIDDVAVFGVPSERWGEIVCAAVVASASVTIDDLRAHLDPDGPLPLAKHQHPRQLLVVDAIPRTAATDQVDRHQLRQLAIQKAQ